MSQQQTRGLCPTSASLRTVQLLLVGRVSILEVGFLLGTDEQRLVRQQCWILPETSVFPLGNQEVNKDGFPGRQHILLVLMLGGMLDPRARGAQGPPASMPSLVASFA